MAAEVELSFSPSTTDLAETMVDLSLSDFRSKHNGERPLASSATTASITSSPSAPSSFPIHARAESTSSISSALFSESSAPHRPARSLLRKSRGGNPKAPLPDIDALRGEVATLLEQIYKIEEVRHSSGPGHAAQLDSLVSQLNDAITAVAPRMAAFQTESSSDSEDVSASLRADWDKVLAQHVQLQQELQEDPWLIRFRTTADQVQGMMDPLEKSLQDVTGYVGRVLSSLAPVPMTAPEGRLSIEKLKAVLGAHARLKAAYVPSINKILKMMSRSVANRAVKNGEALRRVNDMSQRWATLQKQLGHLDVKSSFALSQSDPDHVQADGSMEVLDDAEPFDSPLPSPPLARTDSAPTYPAFGRVLSEGSAIPSPRPSTSLAPPQVTRPGSTTPSAQRPIRRLQSRPSLPVVPASVDRPRWNAASRPSRASPPSTPALHRRPSQGGLGTSTPALQRRPSHGALGTSTPSIRRGAASPAFTSPPNGSRVPLKSMPSTPTTPRYGRQSFGSALGRPPPSAFRPVSPVPSMPARPSSRMSVSSVTSASVTPGEIRPFTPSKYDLLDQEVHRILEEVKPDIFVARLDQPLRRGQRKGDGEQWTGEFIFGAGERGTSVKLLELSGRGPPGAPKRVKVMVRYGGAWTSLASHLEKKREEAECF